MAQRMKYMNEKRLTSTTGVKNGIIIMNKIPKMLLSKGCIVVIENNSNWIMVTVGEHCVGTHMHVG